MFDTMVAAHAPRSHRARTVVITTSVLVHATAFTIIAVAAMWKIDKLPVDNRGITISGLSAPADLGGGGPPLPQKLVAKPVEKRTVPKDTVQPKEPKDDQKVVTDEPAETDQAKEGNPLTTGDGPGDGPGTGTNTTGVVGTCTVEPCGTDPIGDGTKKVEKKVVEKKKVEPKAVVIAPNVASGLRIRGNDQIAAPESVRITMMHEDKEKVIGSVKLCIGTDGNIDRASILKSTGYDAYDSKLLSEMRAWRYKPYKVDGVPMPACTVVTLIYVMK